MECPVCTMCSFRSVGPNSIVIGGRMWLDRWCRSMVLAVGLSHVTFIIPSLSCMDTALGGGIGGMVPGMGT